MDPRMHDHIFAFVSHLPHIVAYSLANTVLAQDDPPEMATYSGGGLRDFTRIAASSPEMWRDIFSMNRDNLLSAVRKFKGSLETLEGLIEKGDWAALAKELGRYSEAKGKT